MVIALILGLIGAGVYTGAVVGLFSSVNLFFILLVVIPWASLALTSKWAGVGGLLLIVSLSLPFLGLASNVLEEHPGALGAAIVYWLNMPVIVVSGVLFILSWWKGRRRPS